MTNAEYLKSLPIGTKVKRRCWDSMLYSTKTHKGWLNQRGSSDYNIALAYAEMPHNDPIHGILVLGFPKTPFLQLIDELVALHNKKSKDYGEAEDPFANYRASADCGVPPWKGCFIRALDKVQRIKRYCKDGKLENEGVRDSFRDLIVHSMIALLLFDEETAQCGS